MMTPHTAPVTMPARITTGLLDEMCTEAHHAP